MKLKSSRRGFLKAGAAFAFPGEREGRIRRMTSGGQAVAFVRDAGATYFNDGTAEREYNEGHDQKSLDRAGEMGLTAPMHRFWGCRPYVPGGPVFRRMGEHLWLATGGRKLGTILGASFARWLVEDELRF